MGWEPLDLNDLQNQEVIGDEPFDELGFAIEKVAEYYKRDWGRLPSLNELITTFQQALATRVYKIIQEGEDHELISIKAKLKKIPTRQKCKVGDVLKAKLKDGQSIYARIFAKESPGLGYMVGVYDSRGMMESELDKIIANPLIVKLAPINSELIQDQSKWKVVGHRPITEDVSRMPKGRMIITGRDIHLYSVNEYYRELDEEHLPKATYVSDTIDEEEDTCFVAVGIKTVNSNLSSICQIGIARYEGGQLIEEWSLRINPGSPFESSKTKSIGISEDEIASLPKLPDIEPQLRTMLEGAIVVFHSMLERKSLARAFQNYNLKSIDAVSVDCTRIVRRVWEDRRYGGYEVMSMSNELGFEISHHDALVNAKACANVIIAAEKKSDVGIEEWTIKQLEPIDNLEPKEKFDARVDGDWFGETIFFANSFGDFLSTAERMASYAGCSIAEKFDKNVSLLVVDDKELSHAQSEAKSKVFLEAKSLVNEGVNIRILKESDFLFLLDGN